jgi:hypothetical protein
MPRKWVTTISKYFDDLESNDLEVRSFCSGFETWWCDRRPVASEISEKEKDALQAVFDVVVVFADNEEELKQIPMYKSESEVRAAVKTAQRTLRNCGAT